MSPVPAVLRIRLLVLVTCALAVAGVGLTAGTEPAAAAKNCGKQVIDEYFKSWRIKYHPQECYASALKQVDPDARMYSGIMAAIRAARARDRAKDAQAASDTADGGGSVAPSDGGGTPPVEPDTAVPVEPIEPLPVDEPPVEVPEAPIEDPGAITATAGEAAAPVPTVDGVVPLPVAILMGLAGLVTLVGVGGLTVRWLDGPR